MNTRLFEIDGEKYYFNLETFKKLFDSKTVIEGKNIGELEIELGEYVGISSDAVHQWRNFKNGPGDIEQIKLIAKFFDVDNYKKLLTERKNHSLSSKNKLTERQIDSIKRISDVFLDVINYYLDTIGYNKLISPFDDENLEDDKKFEIFMEEVDKLQKCLEKEYIFLKNSDVYGELDNFIVEDVTLVLIKHLRKDEALKKYYEIIELSEKLKIKFYDIVDEYIN